MKCVKRPETMGHNPAHLKSGSNIINLALISLKGPGPFNIKENEIFKRITIQTNGLCNYTTLHVENSLSEKILNIS